MTPKEKAKELIKKFDVKHILKFGESAEIPVSMYKEQVLKCALIAVDELILSFEELSIQESGGINMDFGQYFWKEVKLEIKSLWETKEMQGVN